jgi:hypothetical protein
MNTTMDLQVPRKMENSLTMSANVTFLKRTCKGEVCLANVVLIGEVRQVMVYGDRIAACGYMI